MGPLTSHIPILGEEGSVVVRLAFVLVAIGLGLKNKNVECHSQ